MLMDDMIKCLGLAFGCCSAGDEVSLGKVATRFLLQNDEYMEDCTSLSALGHI